MTECAGIMSAPLLWRVATLDGLALIREPHTDWPEHIGITDQLIEMADPEYVEHGDGFVRFNLSGESVLYGIAHAGEPGVDHYDLLASQLKGES